MISASKSIFDIYSPSEEKFGAECLIKDLLTGFRDTYIQAQLQHCALYAELFRIIKVRIAQGL